MAGLLPTEGETLVANLLFKNASVDRGTGLQLGLFTNTPITSAITAATLTEPTGGGYARKTLTDGSWTVTGSVASYALQAFLATGTPYTGSVRGYFIVTTGTTPRIVAIEVDAAGPYVMNAGDTYNVTPNITII